MLLKVRLTEDMKTAMRAQDKARLGIIRLMLAAIKQYEVDERKEADDDIVIDRLGKMIKQRRDSIQQYTQAGKTALAEQEQFEITIIQEYLPKPLSENDIIALIHEAIAVTGAKTPQEMGKVIAHLKPQLAGRADMSAVSQQVKQQLTAE